MSRYLRFGEVAARPGRKTKHWTVSRGDGAFALGVIKWYAHWRRYVFEPLAAMVFDPQCLRELADFCQQMTTEHRNATDRLTPTQLKVLRAMRYSRFVTFSGANARRHGYAEIVMKGGVLIRCYGSPQVFLLSRGYIEHIKREEHTHNTWYKLTALGQARAKE